MWVVVICSFLAIFLTFLDSKGVLKKGMLCGFVLVTLLGCIHYNYGNDYNQYMDFFQFVSERSLTMDDLVANSFFWEPGWVILNHIFSGLGFFALVAFINILINIIYYRIIVKCVDKKWWPLAISIYLLSSSLYVLNFSMMRQGVAVALFLACWPCIRSGKFLKSLLLIIISALFHKSALLLLPFAFIGKFKIRDGKPIAILMGVILLSLYISTSLAPNLFQAVSSWASVFAKDTLDYYEKNEILERTYGLGFLLNLIPFLIGLYLLCKKNLPSETICLIIICMMSYIVAPFGSIMSMLIRYSYYFIAYQVIAIPRMYSMISNKAIKEAVVAIFCLMLLYSYFGFFSNPTYYKDYAEFHTIFEVL